MSKSATRNAWSKPLAAPPGLTPAATKKPVEYIMRERFLHLMLSLVGQNITITLSCGAIIDGVMHTFTPFETLAAEHLNKYVIKAAKVIKGNVDIKGGTLIVGAEKVSNIHVKSIRLEQTSRGGDSFQTDADISAGGSNMKDDLVMAGNAWTSTATAGTGTGTGTEKVTTTGRAGMFGTKTKELSGKIGEWDQFQANENQFGVKASFDENLYTISLDKNNVDKKKQYEAGRIAKEIEGQVSSNMHVAEERGQAVEGDYDEEDLYSGVLVTDKESKERTKLVVKPRNGEEAQKKKQQAAASASGATLPTPALKKMNWAAMVAKSDKKGAPSQDTKEQQNTPKETPAEEKPEEKKEPEPEKEPVPIAKETKKPVEKVEEAKPESKQTEAEKNPDKVKSKKLNASAKSFSFNPSAKTFTPSFSAPAPQSAPVEQHMVMMQPQYMQYHPAGVPAPMMYPQGGYPPQMQYRQNGPYGMMQPGGAPHHQGQVPGPNTGEDTSQPSAESTEPLAAEGGNKEDNNENSASASLLPQEGEKSDDGSSEQAAASQQPGQQGMQGMGYPGGPGYYPGAMPMAGRGPGQQQHYHPQMVSGPPRGYAYPGMPPQAMHQGNMPQYNQMRVPNVFPGQPYMQGGYPGRPMEGGEDGRRHSGRGNAGGRGRGGRSGRGRGSQGRGRGKYNNNNSNQNRNQDNAQDSEGADQEQNNNASE